MVVYIVRMTTIHDESINPILDDTGASDSHNYADGDGERIVTVCAWCLPGEKLFDLYPHLAGNVKISHGLCKRHHADMIAALDRM